ncbi:MAG: hypothetical protein AB7O26_04430 [Planctomycetaceae bacterium]
MARLLVSTVRRHSPANEPSGFLYAIDWDRREILRRVPIIETLHRAHDPNARGGVRGAKGISVSGSEVCIANFSHILRFDSKWNPLGAITNRSCSSIHDIEHDGRSVWAASSRNDVIFQFDPAGRILAAHDMRAGSEANEALDWHPPLVLSRQDILNGTIDFTDPRTHDLETFDAAHVNSLCCLADGDILVSLGIVWGRLTTLFRLKKKLQKAGVWDAFVSVNKGLQKLLGLKALAHSQLVVQPAKARSAVVRIRKDGSRELCLEVPGTSVPSHSLRKLHDNTVLYLNTSAGDVVHFDPHGSAEGAGRLLATTHVGHGFLRGMASVSNCAVILGNKTELVHFDHAVRGVVDRFQYTSDPNESVFDIKVLPSGFALPPQVLPPLQSFPVELAKSADSLPHSKAA